MEVLPAGGPGHGHQLLHLLGKLGERQVLRGHCVQPKVLLLHRRAVAACITREHSHQLHPAAAGAWRILGGRPCAERQAGQSITAGCQSARCWQALCRPRTTDKLGASDKAHWGGRSLSWGLGRCQLVWNACQNETLPHEREGGAGAIRFPASPFLPQGGSTGVRAAPTWCKTAFAVCCGGAACPCLPHGVRLRRTSH